ncbi:MAG: 4-phosphopantetheinyl transferase [Blastocatellia bacterium]|jgi:4'-phosphopantetheinyl transferase|nr:4-phosphopantetheinyl transferase [Blastocatellia bacterium]
MTQSRLSELFPGLPPDQVHVWRVSLDQNPDRISESNEILSADERDRAARFHFAKDRNQFIEARAALRLLLSRYLELSPRELTFSFGSHGKPALAQELSNNLRFNLSRRHGLALVAFASNREIGVDVELVRNDLALFEAAENFFSATESAAWRSLPADLQVRGFYNCWTRKEAYIKARGEGLSFPLRQFDVSLAPGEPARLIEVRGDTSEADRWTLHELPVNEGYVGALAIEGAGVEVICTDWPIAAVSEARA